MDLIPALSELRRTYRENASKSDANRQVTEIRLLSNGADALQAMQDQFTRDQKQDVALVAKVFREEQVGVLP